MRITAITHLERSTIGKPRLWLQLNNGVSVTVQQMYTFDNGQTLFLLENVNASIKTPMILADRDGQVSLSVGAPEFTLKPPRCPDCEEAKRAAYSDATTPGFFRPYCAKHAPKEPPC